MSNLAHKQQEQEEIHIQQPEIQSQTKPRPTRIRVTPGERILAILVIGVVCFMAVKIISTQAAIYQVNKDIQDTQTKIVEQRKENNNLTQQVRELSNTERIWKKAKELGFDLKENNVKVVEKK